MSFFCVPKRDILEMFSFLKEEMRLLLIEVFKSCLYTTQMSDCILGLAGAPLANQRFFHHVGLDTAQLAIL